MNEKQLRIWDLFYTSAFSALLVQQGPINGRGGVATEETSHKAAKIADEMVNLRNRVLTIHAGELVDRDD